MANCHKLLIEYNSIIKLKKSKKESLRISRNNLRERIKKYIKENKDIKVPRFHGQGSDFMDTIINPIEGNYDVDDGIYLIVEEEPKQSIATLHKWICEAVEGYTGTTPIDKNTCVRVIFKKGYHIDLPIYYKIDGKCPKLAHKSKGWIDSDPKEFINWFTNKTDDKGQLRRIVRYLKAWKDYKKGDLPSGLILTILTVKNIKYNSRDDIALRDTLVNIKNSLDSYFCCYRPTTPSNEDLLAGFSQTRKDYFLNMLDSFITSANKAIDAEKQKDASEKWQKQFGARFSCNLAENKSDSLLSAAYKPANLTFPNRPISPRKPGGFA